MFVYCNNNPIIYSDDCGQQPDLVVDTNNDNEADYFVYKYEYTIYRYTVGVHGIIFIPVTYSAEVYIYVGVDRQFFEDSSNIPDGFDKGVDLLVADITEGENIVFYAYQAQHLDAAAYGNVVEVLLEYDADYNRNWGRTKNSLVKEWHYHMVLLGKVGLPDSANIDFDTFEEGADFKYYLDKAADRIIQRIKR